MAGHFPLFGERFYRRGPDELLHDFLVAEEQKRRDRANAVLLAEARLLVDVDFGYLGLAVELLQLFDGRVLPRQDPFARIDPAFHRA